VRKLRQAFDVLRQQGLFDEEQTQRFQHFRKLLRHRLVNAAVKIQAHIHSGRLRGLYALDHAVEQLRRPDPVKLRSGVHLTPRSLFAPRFGGVANSFGRSPPIQA
jgi:hypothetical protein